MTNVLKIIYIDPIDFVFIRIKLIILISSSIVLVV